MNGLRLCVHMRKEETKEGAVQTMPNRVFQGVAEFQETLFMKCTLYGNKGPSNVTKFMSKAFIVSVIAPDIEELDFGKHQVDLSRLLADAMDDRKGEPEKGSSWDTTLDLSGKAKGAKLIISFDHEILDKDSANSGNSSSRFRDSPPHRSSMRTSYSLPNSAHGTPRTNTARPHSNHSPSVSEPGNDYDDLLAMEHLNLDELSSLPAGASEIRGGQAMEVQGFPAIRSHFERPSIPSHDAFSAFPNFEPKLKNFSQIDHALVLPTPKKSVENTYIERDAKQATPLSEEDDASMEDEAEFVVVDKGMEIDALVESSLNKEVVANEAQDDAEEDVDDLMLDAVGELEEKQEGEEVDKEIQNELIEGVHDGEMDIKNSTEELESSLAESEADENGKDKTMASQDIEKKETVTYQMVMRTLDTLLQGSTAKEQPPEGIMDESSEPKDKAGMSVEDAADEQVIYMPYTQGDEEEQVEEEEEELGTTNIKDFGGIADEAAKPEGVIESINTEVVTTGNTLNFDVEGIQDKPSKPGEVIENIDTEVDLVAGEFLHMLESEDKPLLQNSDSEPDSPRARLLKQFEQEALFEGGFGLNLDSPEVPEFLLDETSIDADLGFSPSLGSNSASQRADATSTMDKSSTWDSEDDKELTSIMEAAESELQRATQSMRSRTRAKMLEDAETEALMQEWGLNEKAFVSSPPKHTFKQQEPPPLGKGLGSAVPMKDGGSLRSMNPVHFQSSKGNSGKLLMQVSKPVVVPAEMGSGTVDILRNMASMGIENMALQAMTAMPLEDVTGMSIEQIAIEGMADDKSFRNGRALEGSSGIKSVTKGTSWNDQKFGLPSNDGNGECVSLEDLAPMAIQQIEALAMEGLKIQSDMTEDEAPYALNTFSMESQAGVGDVSRQPSMGTLKGVTGVHLLKGAKVPAETSGGGSGLMDMAISLDEWMLLDAGLYDETETKKDTLAIMAAHHAVHQELVHSGDDEKSRGGRKRQASSSKGTWGCMGNTLTIAMLVQLRDPLRNNEAIGAPMMAFVQAERMVMPPKPRVGKTVSMKGNSEVEEADSEPEQQFKITGVHLAGLKAPQEDKKPGWGSQKQQQTGSRWLIANGMSKSSKSHPLLKSKPTTAPTSGKVKVKQGESLWSISARVHGSGSKWKDIMKLNPHIRNPDVIYENQTIRTK